MGKEICRWLSLRARLVVPMEAWRKRTTTQPVASCTRLPSDSSRLVDEDALQRWPRGPSAITERALSRQHDVPLVGTLWTGTLPAAVDRSAEEVHSRIYT